MKVISIINYKGGVGKTTLTANLAAEMAYRKKRVLIIDLDPQTNLTFSFLKVDEWNMFYAGKRTIKYWFDSIIDDDLERPSFEDLIVTRHSIDIICSHLGLIDVDLELSAMLASGSTRQHRKNFIKTYSLIRNELKQFQELYDVVLFDCPPNFSIVTRNALVASDYYVVPAKMDYLSTLGINYLRNHVRDLVSEYNNNSDNESISPEFLGVIPTMVQIRSGELIGSLQKTRKELIRNNIPVFSSMIRENNTIFATAPEQSTPVVLTRYTNSTHANVVVELEKLTTEFMERANI